MPADVVLTDSRLDPERLMLEGIETPTPVFTVSEVAKTYFARTSHWMRWLEVEKRAFILGGNPEHAHTFAEEDSDDRAQGFCPCGAEQIGTARTEKGARYYTLSEIEKIVHALAEKGHINGAQAANALHIVQTIARVHGYLA